MMSKTENTSVEIYIGPDEVEAAVKKYVAENYPDLEIPDDADWSGENYSWEIKWHRYSETEINP